MIVIRSKVKFADSKFNPEAKTGGRASHRHLLVWRAYKVPKILSLRTADAL